MTEIAKGYVSGKVQGVGFRFFVQQAAKKHNVQGYAKNLDDGRVEVFLSGEAADLWEVKKAVLKGPLISRVDHCEWERAPQIVEHDVYGFNTE